jgi:CheY-like chemotaxis protein
MMQRVFVRVVGFSGVERHSLNTIFRLSQDRQSAREWSFEPWDADSPIGPRLALIDGSSPDASEAMAELETTGGIGIIWVGAISPAKAWRAFQRPLSWPAVLSSMDDYFTPRDQLDIDFGDDTWPSGLESLDTPILPQGGQLRVLLADPEADTRLYLRSKLASFNITQIDQAATMQEALAWFAPERMPRASYDILIVDLDLPGGDPWILLDAAANTRLRLLTQHRMSLSSRMAAKLNRAAAMSKPLDPSLLNTLFSKI